MRRRNKKAEEERFLRLKEAIEKAERNIRMGNVTVMPIEDLPAYQRYQKLKAQFTRGDLMESENIEIAKRFPLLLAEMLTPSDGPMNTSLRRYGLECGPGWRPLLEVLFAKLEAEIAALPEVERHRHRAVQIKQKFGSLRVYVDEAATPAMREAMEEAEAASTSICDVCSKPGKLRNRKELPTATRCRLHVKARW
jgi:hypothetical protein